MFTQEMPPSNVQAEQALLGALLSNNRALARCGALRPEHFVDPCHQAIFEAITCRIEAGRLADPVTLQAQFEHSAVLDEVGGIAYLTQLLSAMVGIINAGDYAKVIVDTAHHRDLIAIGEEIVNAARTGRPPEEIAELAAKQIDLLSRTGTTNRQTSLAVAMDDAIAAMERAQNGATAGLSAGFKSFDQRLGGLEPGLVYVIGGRPGMGKSSLGHQIALAAAEAGHGVLELSLEMSARQLGRRTLATAARVPIARMKSGAVSEAEAARLVVARKKIARLPLTIDDTAGQTANQIAATICAERRKHKNLGLVLIDHLNLIVPDQDGSRHGGTWAVERASSTVLEVAKNCDVPVLLLCQLNRGVEGREDKRPILGDLRQSGAIEQDAYAVGFVYRPEYYLRDDTFSEKQGETDARRVERRKQWDDEFARTRGKAELIWAKVRDGETGIDHLLFDGPTATFSEPAGEAE